MATAPSEIGAEGGVAGRWTLTWEQREVLEQADRFARERLHPLQARMDEEEWWPEGMFAECARYGFMGLTAPASYGGADMDYFTAMLVGQAVTHHVGDPPQHRRVVQPARLLVAGDRRHRLDDRRLGRRVRRKT